MDVIGVLDLRRGRAVHAVAGERERYEPVRVGHDSPGDAAALARFYVGTLGISELYAADLDAILDRAPQASLVRDIAAVGAPLWLDAGVASLDEARAALETGARHVVVGLETLPSFDTLHAICRGLGRDRVAFSLDLRERTPVTPSDTLAAVPCEDLIIRARDAGVGSVIVLDLARVGTQAGPDLDLIERIRAAAPGMTLIAGGGVRGAADLVGLKNAGCHAALVATALLNGQLTAHDIHSLRSSTSPST